MVAPLIWIGMGIVALFEACNDETIRPPQPLPFPDRDYDSNNDVAITSDQEDGFDETAEDRDDHSCQPDLCEDGYVLIGDENNIPDICATFTEVSDDVGLYSSDNQQGVSVVDFDQDGRSDVYVFNQENQTELYRNTIQGFSEESAQHGLNVNTLIRNASWHDYDKDGDLDVLLVGAEGSILYENEDGSYIPFLESSGEGIHDPNPARTAIWTGGGFYIGTENGTRFYQYLGDDIFEETTNRVGLNDPGDAHHIAGVDLDNNGTQDLIHLASPASKIRVFEELGDGTYSSIEDGLFFNDVGEEISLEQTMTVDSQWFRYQGEENPSLLTGAYGLNNRFLINQNDGSYSDHAPIFGTQDSGNTTHVRSCDLFNNKRPSVIVGRDNQQIIVSVPVLKGDEKKVTGYKDQAWPLGMAINGTNVGIECFDYNVDGKPDILFVMADGGKYLFENQSKEMKRCAPN